ncbi:hypothetical protein PINS_up011233 [Pythium insidiosum]|nr:hypothetical protein PINS_up011233 [Pythium insidiosum]
MARVLRLVLATAVALAAMACVTCHAAECTDEEIKRLTDVAVKMPRKCFVLRTFRICDDDCLQAIEEKVNAAGNCTEGEWTQRQHAMEALNECRGFRADATNKYMPQPAEGLRECELDDMHPRRGKGQAATTESDDDCVPSSCTEACVKTYEDSVSKAAQCASDGYSLAEGRKARLWRCLVSLGKNPLKNEVMMTVVHADGSVTTNTATVKKSAPPTSNGGSAASGGSGKSSSSNSVVASSLMTVSMVMWSVVTVM